MQQEQVCLLEMLRSIFDSHILRDRKHMPMGVGETRVVYEIGTCEIGLNMPINLLLKLNKDPDRMTYSEVATCECGEFGAFETYYNFVAGYISTISFLSMAKYKKYHATYGVRKKKPYTFSLADSWGGTQVTQGDIGALPYFQMVVKYKGLYGYLTEGLPPLIEPNHTAECYDTDDISTVSHGRIIDLSSNQCLLREIDKGGLINLARRHPNNLGVRTRGKKYFLARNRLDI